LYDLLIQDSGLFMSLQNQLDALNTAVEGVGNAIASKNAGFETMFGNDRGLVSVNASGPLKNTAGSTTDVFGFTYQTIGGLSADISTALPAGDVANEGKRITFFNSSPSFSWTLTGANFNSSIGQGVNSITLLPNTCITLEHDGVSYNALGGTGVMGPSTTVSSAAPSGGKNGDIWYQV
jgi:hypothetical protein